MYRTKSSRMGIYMGKRRTLKKNGAERVRERCFLCQASFFLSTFTRHYFQPDLGRAASRDPGRCQVQEGIAHTSMSKQKDGAARQLRYGHHGI